MRPEQRDHAGRGKVDGAMYGGAPSLHGNASRWPRRAPPRPDQVHAPSRTVATLLSHISVLRCPKYPNVRKNPAAQPAAKGPRTTPATPLEKRCIHKRRQCALRAVHAHANPCVSRNKVVKGPSAAPQRTIAAQEPQGALRYSMYACCDSESMSSRSMSTKKCVSSGAATHRMEQQSRVALSLPLAVKRSPTCSVCTHSGAHICAPGAFCTPHAAQRRRAPGRHARRCRS